MQHGDALRTDQRLGREPGREPFAALRVGVVVGGDFCRSPQALPHELGAVEAAVVVEIEVEEVVGLADLRLRRLDDAGARAFVERAQPAVPDLDVGVGVEPVGIARADDAAGISWTLGVASIT